MITYICAWCGKDMRHVPDEKELISHGMCPACEVDVRADAARSSATLTAVKSLTRSVLDDQIAQSI